MLSYVSMYLYQIENGSRTSDSYTKMCFATHKVQLRWSCGAALLLFPEFHSGLSIVQHLRRNNSSRPKIRKPISLQYKN